MFGPQQFSGMLGKRPAAVAAGVVTWDPGVLVRAALSPGNLTVTDNTGSGSGNGSRSTTSHSSGKYYLEMTCTNSPGGTIGVGVADSTHTIGSSFLGSNTHSTCYYNPGLRFFNGSDQGGMASLPFTTSDIISMAIDLNARKIWWMKNNNGFYCPVHGSGDPVGNVGGGDLSTFATNVYVAVDFEGANTAAFTANFGATAFAFTAPSGFGNW